MALFLYFIKTYATEDKPDMVCSYPKEQWLELQKEFKEQGIKHLAWRAIYHLQ